MDQISDMIIRIKNAGNAGQSFASMPFSKMKEQIATVLFQQGYVSSYSKKGKKVVKALEVGIAYNGKHPRITNVARMSKPSCRLYMKASEIKPVRNNQGLLILSTPKGIMTGNDARKAQVGGEALFKIW